MDDDKIIQNQIALQGKLYIKNYKKVEAKLKQIIDAIQCLLDTRILRVSQDIELEALLGRAGEYITRQIKVGVRA